MRNARREEVGRSEHQDTKGARLIEDAPEIVGVLDRPQIRSAQWRVADGFPELPQFFDPLSRRVARDQGRVYGADGNARDPVGMEIGLGKRLVDSALIGAQCAAALKQQGNALEWG